MDLEHIAEGVPTYVGDGSLPNDPEERIRLKSNTVASNKVLDQRIITPLKKKIQHSDELSYQIGNATLNVSEREKQVRLKPSEQFERFRGYLSDKYGDKLNGDRVPGIRTFEEYYISVDKVLVRLDWYQKVKERQSTRTLSHNYKDSFWLKIEPILQKHIDDFCDTQNFPEIELDGIVTQSELGLYLTAQYVKQQTNKAYVKPLKEKKLQVKKTTTQTTRHSGVKEQTKTIPDSARPYRQVLTSARTALESKDDEHLLFKRRGETYYVSIFSLMRFMYQGLEKVQFRQRIEKDLQLLPEQFVSFRLPSASSN